MVVMVESEREVENSVCCDRRLAGKTREGD